MKKISFFILMVFSTFFLANAQKKENTKGKYDSYKGLVMCGYQGWFSTPDDGSNRGWGHLGQRNVFKSGNCNIDLWPDVSEYEKTYPTGFKMSDSTVANIFSSRDESTVDLHFKWMKQYGIDGAFMQRFVGELKQENGINHFNRVLDLAMNSAKKYDRAISMMYDLSGMKPGDEQILLADMDKLAQKYDLFKRKEFPTYLYHNKKPLVTIWGVGFNDHRAYGLKEAEIIVNTLKLKGFSVMLGVPTYWREFGNDTNQDSALHSLIKKCDIILPWFVGRYTEYTTPGFKTYTEFKDLIPKDIEWCKQNKVDYVPLVYPGFSWKNMKGANTLQIPRNKGSFFWSQIASCVNYGSEMLYVAMFDEMDEGTAIFKCTNNVPVGESKFCGFEGMPSDYYLWLTGQAAEMLKKRQKIPVELPVRK